MRALVPIAKCDRCDEPIAPDTRSSQVNATWPDGTVDRLAGESCDTCLAELQELVRGAVASFLVQDTGPAKRQARTSSPSGLKPAKDPNLDPALRTCTVCPREGREYVARTRSALGQHLKAQHQTSFGELGLALPGGRGLREAAPAPKPQSKKRR